MLAALTKHSEESEPRPSLVVKWPQGKSPYPGLPWFNEEYAPLFFGRDREVDALVVKMSEPGGGFLLISGASGSGKSSLVAAGLWQAVINKGRLPGSKRWVWQRIQPGDGETPFHSLAWGLKQAFPSMSKRAPDLAKELVENQTTIGELLAHHLDQGQELVLIIDQLEELFTQSFTNEDIRHFLDRLISTARNNQSQLRVVATIRDEFVGRLAESESMRQVLNAGCNYFLGPVSPRDLQDMIEQPAQATGYDFEPGLVVDILRDTAQEPGSLPLVAYGLKQLFERRRERTFTRDAYIAIGGVTGAISTQADQVMAGLDEKTRGSFDKVFAELVHIQRERPPTRRRVNLAVFNSDKAANLLIDTLAGPGCRILVRAGEGPKATVEVAHETLITAWPKLKDWINGCGEALRLIDYEEEAASRWHDSGGHLNEMWRRDRVQLIEQALNRFDKTPSSKLESLLRPQQMLIERLNIEILSHQERFLIGQKLSEFGDPRPGIGLQPDGLPDISWIDVPLGLITLEGVDHVFEVKPFRIARYLVTNAQFDAFLYAEDGYRNEAWWNGIRRCEETSLASWQDANSPRETVSWFESVAFCRWLSHRTRSIIRLPAEWEWQQTAMSGNSMLEYPWPGGWDTCRCNSTESRLNRTTAVGLYPRGVTQQGVFDMAGNLWEWCLNAYEHPQLSESLLIDDKDSPRAVRGGSWLNRPGYLRVSNRFRYRAEYRNAYIGFRLAQETEE
ncbi:MAG: formylglycine-generating enzyme family protein [Nitrospira sp.]|nr:formylglycine-generating enzyme family protein [Nitrospira sp.]